jgi:hypothetical protein
MPVRSGSFPAAAQHGLQIVYEFAQLSRAAKRRRFARRKARPLMICGYSVADLGASFAE